MSDQSTIDANGAASAEDVMAVVDGVNEIAEGWAQFAVQELQHNADDPCYREIVLLDRRDASGAHRNVAENLSQGAAEDLQGAIALSLQGYMRDSVPGVWMHKSFLDWLIERNVLGADPTAIGLLLGGPIGAAAGKDYVRDRLPLSSQFDGGGPKRNPPAGKGLRIRPGVYMYAPGANPDPLAQLAEGRLQGTTIRAEFWRWKHYIERTVSGFARPLARWELRQLVGGGTGTELGEFTMREGAPAWVWRVGDPIDPNSIVGHLQEQEANLERLILGAGVECNLYRQRQAELQDLAIESGQVELGRDFETRQGWQRVAIVGSIALAFALVARRLT
jgi:hypothetical protein